MKKLSAFLAFCALAFSLRSQTVTHRSPENAWIPYPVVSNVSTGINRKYAASHDKGIVYTDGDAAIFPVKYAKEKFGIVKVDASAKTLWEMPLPGYVIGIGRLNGSVLAFYTNEWEESYYAPVVKTIYAVTLDPRTGKKLKEKAVFQGSRQITIDPKMHIDADGEFRNLLIRHTNHNGKRLFDSDPMVQTQSMELVVLGNDLQPTSRALNSLAVNNKYISSIMTSSKDLYVMSQQEDRFIVERFDDASPTALDKFSISAPVYEKADITPIVSFSKQQPDKIYVGIHTQSDKKTYVTRLFAVNVTEKKIKMHEDVLNKEYGEMLDSQSAATRQKKLRIKRDIENLKVAGLVIDAGRVIFIRQPQFASMGMSRQSDRDYANDIVVSVFNNDLKNTGNLVVKREYEMFITIGEEIGYKLTGNQLHLVYNVTSGMARFSGEYAVINLDKLSIENKELLDKKGMAGGDNVSGQSTLWFNNKMVVPYYIGNRSKEAVLHAIALK